MEFYSSGTNLSGTRVQFHGRQFFPRGGQGGVVPRRVKNITLIVHLISTIITSPPPQIIRHQVPKLGTPVLEGAQWEEKLGRWGSDRGSSGIPLSQGLQRNTADSEIEGKIKSFRQDAERIDNSSVSYNLEINHTLGKIFSKRKIVFYHFLLKSLCTSLKIKAIHIMPST